jgi:putative transposase
MDDPTHQPLILTPTPPMVEDLGPRQSPRDDRNMPNTFSSLHYQIVFSTKNRQPFINDEFRSRLHQYLGGCVREVGGTALETGGVEDHVHLLVRLKPTHCVADVLRAIKKGSSEWIRKETLFQWQDGYSAFAVSRSDIERVRRYIQDQQEHHKQRTFEEEYRQLLIENGIDFDERYLL